MSNHKITKNMLPITNELKNHLSFQTENASDSANLREMSLLDTILNKGDIIEPHYHLNGVSLIYIISGALDLTLINPQTKKEDVISLTKGEMMTIPQSWWHYKQATKNKTQLITVFNKNDVQTIYGSDLVNAIPHEILKAVYGVDSKQLQKNKPINSAKKLTQLETDQKVNNMSDEFNLTSRLLPYDEESELERSQTDETVEPDIPTKSDYQLSYIYPYYCYRCGQIRYFRIS